MRPETPPIGSGRRSRFGGVYRETFGPAVAAYAGAGDEVGTLDRAFLDFATRRNRGAGEGPSEYQYEYLLVIATKG